MFRILNRFFYPGVFCRTSLKMTIYNWTGSSRRH